MQALQKILNRLKPDVQPRTVDVFTRHNPDCTKRKDKHWRRCNCPKAVYIFQERDFRLSAGTRSWENAENLKQELKDSLNPLTTQLRQMRQEQEAARVTVSTAVELYLSDAEARNLAPVTLRKRKGIFRNQLLSWADKHSLVFLDHLTTSQLTQWRSTWTLAPITKRNQQEILRGFFRFCIGQGWLKTNPALQLTRIQVNQTPTDYFTRGEFDKLVEATSLYARGSRNPNDQKSPLRIRTLLLLMRWSGLRIGDAVTLERSRLIGNRILLYQAKTGTSVYVPIPTTVAELLRNVPPGNKPNPRYFFWTGNGSRTSVVSSWERSFQKLFRIANILKPDGTAKKCHVHMLRDTFAIEHLLAGVPIDQVSMLLGHKSIKTTERHYAPWVKARQEQLENSVRVSNSSQGIEQSHPPRTMAQRNMSI
jgi:integrase/recombinase XerD